MEVYAIDILAFEVKKLINRLFQIHVTDRYINTDTSTMKFIGQTHDKMMTFHVKLDNYKYYTVKLTIGDKHAEFLYEPSSKLKCVLVLMNGIPTDTPKYVYEIFE